MRADHLSRSSHSIREATHFVQTPTIQFVCVTTKVVGCLMGCSAEILRGGVSVHGKVHGLVPNRSEVHGSSAEHVCGIGRHVCSIGRRNCSSSSSGLGIACTVSVHDTTAVRVCISLA